MEYVGRLLRGYPQFSLEFIENELPMIKGWIFINFYLENDGWLAFSGLKRSSKGYIAQEIEKLEKQYFDKFGKKEK